MQIPSAYENPKKLKIAEDGYFGKDPTYKEWEEKQNRYNDGKVQDGRLIFPVWYITSKKIIQVEHSLFTGNTDVIMETKGKDNIRLKMDAGEWTAFETKTSLIKDFIDAVEGVKNVDEVLAYWKIEKYKDTKYCRVPVNHDMRITFSWKDDDKTCSVDIRRGTQDIIDAEGKYWKSSDSGMYLTAPSCKYLLQLIQKVSIAFKMFRDMHSQSHDLFLSLFSYPIADAKHGPPAKFDEAEKENIPPKIYYSLNFSNPQYSMPQIN